MADQLELGSSVLFLEFEEVRRLLLVGGITVFFRDRLSLRCNWLATSMPLCLVDATLSCGRFDVAFDPFVVLVIDSKYLIWLSSRKKWLMGPSNMAFPQIIPVGFSVIYRRKRWNRPLRISSGPSIVEGRSLTPTAMYYYAFDYLSEGGTVLNGVDMMNEPSSYVSQTGTQKLEHSDDKEKDNDGNNKMLLGKAETS
ncbi:hypothetical protein Tco_0349616 [Tanacetum coccineum]